jgi:hypothetical protein
MLNTGHACGSITDKMKIIEIKKRRKRLNILEKYHIYKINKNRLHMTDTYIDVYNPIFEILQEFSAR